MNDKTLLKVKVTGVYLIKGNYEGFDYYKLQAETDLGITASKKLTEFEYYTLKGQYVDNSKI